MVLGGQKWSDRLGVCDPRVRGALLFRCMVAELCWHFSNFPWLCKVFFQTFLHFASQFRNLKAISKLGGHFAAISKLGDHFAAKWHFRKPFRSCEMSVWGFQMALVCQKVVSQPQNTLRNWEFLCFATDLQLQNTLRNGALAMKLEVFMLRSHFAAAK